MAYEALKRWAAENTARTMAAAVANRSCCACDQEAYLAHPDTDLDAAMMGTHAIPHHGIYCRKLKNRFPEGSEL